MQHADLAFLRMAVNLFSQAYRYGKPNEPSGGAVDKYFSRDLPLPISFNQEEGNQVTSCLLQSSVLQTLKNKGGDQKITAFRLIIFVRIKIGKPMLEGNRMTSRSLTTSLYHIIKTKSYKKQKVMVSPNEEKPSFFSRNS